MRKKLLIGLLVVLFTLTGCKLSVGRTYENLLEGYIKAYTEADLNEVHNVFPPFYVEYSKDQLTQEYLENQVKKLKTQYGDDVKITYELTDKKQLTEKELKSLNENMARIYNSKENASECYRYEGNLITKGSLKEYKSSLSSMGYCKYNNTWYLVALMYEKEE